MSAPEETEEPLSKAEQIREFMMLYGKLALAVWWGMFFAVALPIAFLAWSKGGVSVWIALGIGWAGAQPSKLIRFPLFLVITPVLARWIGREPIAEAAAGGAE